ncbi:hypothetical protein F4604DRAFT_1686730 [Suillus subluteus]|nr:hypothetical protein F4604DRAFT_1686730 [Suillus subluteus]
MSTSTLSRLPIHMLKQILYEAPVHLLADLLENGELVARVSAWLDKERTAAEEEISWKGRRGRREGKNVEIDDESLQHPPPPSTSPLPLLLRRTMLAERSGLCVIGLRRRDFHRYSRHRPTFKVSGQELFAITMPDYDIAMGTKWTLETWACLGSLGPSYYVEDEHPGIVTKLSLRLGSDKPETKAI